MYGVNEVKMKTPWMSTSPASGWICGVVLVLTLLSATGCSAIAVGSDGGNGTDGSGSAPAINVAPVPALW